MLLREKAVHCIMSEVRIMQKGYLWNSLASMMTAISSIGVLLIVTRFAGNVVGANFSIAVAIINVLMNIGTMNALGYQISDVKEKYVFNTYFKQRCLSVVCMVVSAFFYAIGKYGVGEKSFIIITYGIYKAINVFCEVFQGRYQQQGRVDIASELNFIKALIPDSVLCIVTIISSNFSLAIIIAIMVETITILVFNSIVWQNFSENKEGKAVHIIHLTKEILPLFFSAFAAAYILNSAKYAIDDNMSSQHQLIYTILLLPATTVHMIAGFIYRPVLTVYANIWNDGKREVLAIKVLKTAAAILLTTSIIVCVREIILTILTWAYGVTELREYGTAFGILLTAGGLNALNTFMSYIITIIRKQSYLYIINTITFICALIIPHIFVVRGGIFGAAFSYLVLMFVQMVNYFICFGVFAMMIKKQKEREGRRYK